MHLVTLPSLNTERLVLRPFELEDAMRVEELAGNYQVARFTEFIPHPYPAGDAAKWIATHLFEYLQEKAIVLAIQKKDGLLIGAIQLTLHEKNHRAELGYWIGQPYWSNGFCSEAARAIVNYGFREWKLHRISAHYLSLNPASGRVMQKIGMMYEGTLREHTVHSGKVADMIIYGVLRSEWLP